jgi:hypothetical protein
MWFSSKGQLFKFTNLQSISVSMQIGRYRSGLDGLGVVFLAGIELEER